MSKSVKYSRGQPIHLTDEENSLFRQQHFVRVSWSEVFQETTLACEGEALEQLLQLAAGCPVQERLYEGS